MFAIYVAIIFFLEYIIIGSFIAIGFYIDANIFPIFVYKKQDTKLRFVKISKSHIAQITLLWGLNIESK